MTLSEIAPSEKRKVTRLVNQFLPPEYDREFIIDTILTQAWEKDILRISRQFVRNKCTDAWRKSQRERKANEAFFRSSKPESIDIQKQASLKSTIEKAVTTCLSNQERRLIWMRFYNDQTTAEIAEDLESNQKEIQKELRVALYKMRLEIT